jgi:GT2 family glycosyltransferase
MPVSDLDLSIIIVTWNVWEPLQACLRSIEQVSQATDAAGVRQFGPPHSPRTLEVIVVDNASSDGAAERLPAAFPWARLMRNAINVGFTGGNNRGYAEGRGRFVFFLNPDTEVMDSTEGSSLWRLYAAVEADETVALAGPQLRYPDGSVQSSRRRFPARLTGFWESTWLGRAWPANPWAQRLTMSDWPVDFQHDVDWVMGAAMMARRSALEAIRQPQDTGPFDEGFFMYSEEVDLCRRLKLAGWRIVYVPDAQIVHHEGRSSEQVVAARHIHFNTSKVYYYRKYFGPAWAEAVRRYLLLEYRWQLWVERAKWLVGHKRDLRAQRINAYRQVIASGLHSRVARLETRG